MRNQALIAYFSKVRRAEALAAFLRQAISEAERAIEWADRVKMGIPRVYVNDPESPPLGYQKLHVSQKLGDLYQLVSVPPKPEKGSIRSTKGFDTIFVICVVLAVICYVVLVARDWGNGNLVEKFICILIAPVVIVLYAMLLAAIPELILLIVRWIKVPEKNQADIAQWERDRVAVYKQAETDNRQMEARRGDIKFLQDDLHKEMTHWRRELAEMELEIAALYDQERIPQQVRGLRAAHYMLDYLELGVCTELEGRDGCFAQYLNDARADRICASIQEVVKAVQENTRAVRQNTLAIYLVGSAILENQVKLGEMIEESLGKMESFAAMVQEDAKRIAQQNDLRQASLDKLNSTQTAMAWNHYIAVERMGISGARLKRP